jgi:hypothetical protein
VTRLLQLLRGHGLIAKVCKSHRYQLTQKGRTCISYQRLAGRPQCGY